jgi:cell division protein FtsW (lipid II flippase)
MVLSVFAVGYVGNMEKTMYIPLLTTDFIIEIIRPCMNGFL